MALEHLGNLGVTDRLLDTEIAADVDPAAFRVYQSGLQLDEDVRLFTVDHLEAAQITAQMHIGMQCVLVGGHRPQSALALEGLGQIFAQQGGGRVTSAHAAVAEQLVVAGLYHQTRPGMGIAGLGCVDPQGQGQALRALLDQVLRWLRILIHRHWFGFGQQRTATQGQQGSQQACGQGQTDHGSYSSKVSRPSRKRAGLSSRRRVMERSAVRLPRSSEMAGSSCPRPCMPLAKASLLSVSICSRVSLVLAIDARVCSMLSRVRVPCSLTSTLMLLISSVACSLAAVSSLISA